MTTTNNLRVNKGRVDWGRLVTRCPTGDAHEWDHPPQNVWTCRVCGLKHQIGSRECPATQLNDPRD